MTEKNRIYIISAKQISMQQPLTEEWMTNAISSGEPLAQTIDPPFREYIDAREVRRMSNICKRALVTMHCTLADTGIEQPDAIISGTGVGCLKFTEHFLDDLCENHEEMLSPTYFMQSTHNTVSSTLAIHTHNHGYNTTYSHGETSFDLALQDACMQMRLGDIGNALVGGYDEMVESYFSLLRKTGYVGMEGMVPCGEVSVSMLLDSVCHAHALCELCGISILHAPSAERMNAELQSLLRDAGLQKEDISYVLTGMNGNPQNDYIYNKVSADLLPRVPLLRFKHLFGENFTASAFGIYVAAHCLHESRIPSALLVDEAGEQPKAPRALLVLNQKGGSDITMTLLKRL